MTECAIEDVLAFILSGLYRKRPEHYTPGASFSVNGRLLCVLQNPQQEIPVLLDRVDVDLLVR
jgi:hypothetical protein